MAIITNVKTYTSAANSTGDSITGAPSADTLSGGLGNDTILGLGGDDSIDGGAGIDVVNYSNELYDNNGPVQLTGHGVVVKLANGTASDNWGNQDLMSNIEQVRGSQHDYSLVGDANNNSLHGGAGDDTLDGGAGNDKCVFITLADLGKSLSQADSILDFTNGDKIDLTGINEFMVATTGRALSFAEGLADPTQSLQGTLWFENGTLYLNSTGQTDSLSMIKLLDVANLASTDIVYQDSYVSA